MWTWAVIFYYCFTVSFGADVAPKVETPNGVVVGHYRKSYNGRVYSAFEGIPYAKKPVGELRFQVGVAYTFFYSQNKFGLATNSESIFSVQEPQPAEPWTGELYANETYTCMQYSPLPMMKGALGKKYSYVTHTLTFSGC